MSYIPMICGGGTETTYVDGSTWSYTSNCTYQNGGLYKTGRIAQIVLKLKVNVAGTTSNPPLIRIDNIPCIPDDSTGIYPWYFMACGTWKTYGKEVQGYMQGNSDLSQNGLRISLCNPNIAVDDELRINVVFICKE